MATFLSLDFSENGCGYFGYNEINNISLHELFYFLKNAGIAIADAKRDAGFDIPPFLQSGAMPHGAIGSPSPRLHRGGRGRFWAVGFSLTFAAVKGFASGWGEFLPNPNVNSCG